MGRVGFGRFVILWPKPNPTRYKKKFCNPTQPNLSSPKNQPNPMGQVWRVDGFSAHPYSLPSLATDPSDLPSVEPLDLPSHQHVKALCSVKANSKKAPWLVTVEIMGSWVWIVGFMGFRYAIFFFFLLVFLVLLCMGFLVFDFFFFFLWVWL